MKMKKFVLLFSMIAVFFSLTACSDGQEEVTFEYEDEDIIYSTLYDAYQMQNVSDAYRAYFADSEDGTADVVLTGIANFDSAKEECGDFKGYRSKEDGSSIEFDFSKLNAEDEETYYAALEELDNLLAKVDATVEESGSNVIVTLKAVYEERDVEYSFVYEENPKYAYYEALYSQSVTPYQVKEVTATPDYTISEKMINAASNTLMGMGTVFIVLIFISFIIGQFKHLNTLSVKFENWWANRGKDKDTEETAAIASEVSAPVATPVANPMDDTQLVAVITAAETAANTAAGGSDKLIVRSIRKAKR